MTEEEAISRVDEIKLTGGIPTDLFDEFFDVCREDLQKQIPKEPWRQADDDTCVYYHWECPSCGAYMGHTHYESTYKFCPDCGQALKWED